MGLIRMMINQMIHQTQSRQQNLGFVMHVKVE